MSGTFQVNKGGTGRWYAKVHDAEGYLIGEQDFAKEREAKEWATLAIAPKAVQASTEQRRLRLLSEASARRVQNVTSAAAATRTKLLPKRMR